MSDTPLPPAPAAEAPPQTASPPPLPRRFHDQTTYRHFIWSLLGKKEARNYLEVGVRDGRTLAEVNCPSIGVDPLLAFKVNPMGKKQVLHLYQMTSDAYFKSHDPRAVFGGPVDVAFLDGLHLFEYLLRDFINTERVCDRNSVIILDDCLPVNAEMTERTHRPDARLDQSVAGWWTGDVWKVVTILRRYRPDLRIIPVTVQPTGLIVIANLDPDSTVLSDSYFALVDEFAGLELEGDAFEAYWRTNAPRAPQDLLNGVDLSLFVRP